MNPRNWMARRNLARLTSFLTAFLLLILTPAGHAAPQSLAPSEFTAGSFTQELQRLKSGLNSAGRSTEALRAYRETLPKTWAVDAGGRHFVVPTNSFSSRLALAEKRPEKRAENLTRASEYLDALAAEVSSLSGGTPQPMDSARPKLDSILARPEYTRIHPQSWYEKLRQRINDLLLRALVRVLRGVGGQATLGLVLLWLGLAVAVVLIAYWVFRNWFRGAKAAELALGALSVPSLSWQEWIFAAREAAGRGDYRVAVHCAYWAGIGRLQDVGALAPDRAKTPREYLRALTKSKLVPPEGIAARNQAITDLTTRLERIWYGYDAATEADFRDSLARLETLGCRLP